MTRVTLDPAQLQQDLKAAALPLEAKRLSTLKFVAGAYVVIGLLTLYVYMQLEDFEVLLIGGAGAAALYPFLAGKFVSAFKDQVMKAAVARLGSGLEYRHKGHIDQGSFLASHLYPGLTKAYKGEDVVWGQLGEAEFGFSELRVVQAGALGSSAETFRGLFLEIKRPEMPKGHVLVLTRNGDAPTRADKQRGEPVAFPEDPAFEAAFLVLARREASARAVLDPAMRERLLALQETAGGTMHVAFTKQKIFVAVPHHDDLFEPALLSPLTDAETLSELADSLLMPTTIALSLGQSTSRTAEPEQAPRPRARREKAPEAAPEARSPQINPRELRVVMSMVSLLAMGLLVLYVGFGGLTQVVANQFFGGYDQRVRAEVIESQLVTRQERYGSRTYNKITYRFEADGQTFTGNGEVRAREAPSGGAVEIKYASRNPRFSLLSSQEAYDIGLTIWTVMSYAGVLGLGVLPVLGLIYRKQVAEAGFLG